MTVFEYSDTGFTLYVAWQWLFLILVAALFITLARMTAKTHRLKIPQLHEHPAFNLALWCGAMLAVLLTVIALYEFAAILLITDYLGDDTDRHTALRNVSLFLAAVFSAPFLVWRTVIASKQAHTAEQGLYTDRIAKAVEQIGADKVVKQQRKDENGNLTYERDGDGNRIFSKPVMIEETVPNLEVRIGGLYALERIARDSLDDHLTVMEILCAYIRENSHPEVSPLPAEAASNEEWLDWHKKNKQEPRNDVKIALNIIGKRTPKQLKREEQEKFVLDFTGVDLRGVIFTVKNLSPANFSNAELQGCIIHNTDLREANFNFTKMQMSTFWESDLSNSRFLGNNLFHANFDDALMHNVHFNTCTFENTQFKQAQLLGASFRRSCRWFENTCFYKANLKGVGFSFIRPLKARAANVNYLEPMFTSDQLEVCFGDDTIRFPKLTDNVQQCPVPKAWSSQRLTPPEFEVQWRAFQQSIGFDPENPVGSA